MGKRYKNSTAMRKRLEFLQMLAYLSEPFSVVVLKTCKLASEDYGEVCLQVDKWYFSHKRNQYDRSKVRVYDGDPYVHLCLNIIIQAIADAMSGRPCDMGKWINDLAPKGKRGCIPTAHVCAQDAISYLQNCASNWETCVGLKDGTLEGYIEQIKKDRCGDRSCGDINRGKSYSSSASKTLSWHS
jgi:hypothetical protein